MNITLTGLSDGRLDDIAVTSLIVQDAAILYAHGASRGGATWLFKQQDDATSTTLTRPDELAAYVSEIVGTADRLERPLCVELTGSNGTLVIPPRSVWPILHVTAAEMRQPGVPAARYAT